MEQCGEVADPPWWENEASQEMGDSIMRPGFFSLAGYMLVVSLVPLAFVIYRLAWRDERGRRTPSLGFLVALTAGVWLTVIFVLIVDKVARSRWAPILRDIRLAQAEDIKAIQVLPWPHEAPSLVADPVTIKDKKLIREIVRFLRTAKRYAPEHPSSNWECILALDYGDRKVYCNVSSTRGNGVLIDVYSDITSGWALGTFREDGLGKLLEKIVREAKETTPSTAPATSNAPTEALKSQIRRGGKIQAAPARPPSPRLWRTSRGRRHERLRFDVSHGRWRGSCSITRTRDSC